MADRTLLEYEEERNPDGPYWTLTIERSAAGPPGGIVTIAFRSLDGTLTEDRRSIVMDDLRRLFAATDWAAGIDDRQREIQQLGKTRIGSSIGRDMDRAILGTRAADAEIAALRALLGRIRGMGRTSHMVHGTALAAYVEGGLAAIDHGATQ